MKIKTMKINQIMKKMLNKKTMNNNKCKKK